MPDDKKPTSKDDDAIEDAYFQSAFEETVYNDSPINWRYWVLQMPTLTAVQAARLMSGLDPDIFDNLEARPNKNDPSRRCRRAKSIQRLAETQGKQSASPAEWLDWAKSQGFSVHAGFTLAVGELPNASQLEQTDRNAKTGTNVKKWDDAKLRALWEESNMPGATQKKLAKKHDVSRQRIATLIKQAKGKFSTLGGSTKNKYSGLLIHKMED